MEKKVKLLKECEICGENAICLCYKCKEFLCDPCFKMIHDKIKSNHKKEKIDMYIPIEINCQEHPDVPLNLFCVDEKGI